MTIAFTQMVSFKSFRSFETNLSSEGPFAGAVAHLEPYSLTILSDKSFFTFTIIEAHNFLHSDLSAFKVKLDKSFYQADNTE